MPPLDNATDQEQYAWNIYAKQLFPLGHGYPLWMPDPDPSASMSVEIGDVGWIDQGGFFQLFNVTRGEDDRQAQGGVPESFVPLRMTDLRVVGPTERIMQRYIHSRTIMELNVSGGASAGK